MEDALTLIASPEVSFRRVEETDFPLLTTWLAEPHVRRFYQKTPVTLQEVAAEYGPMVRGENATLCHLALDGAAPFAYVQAYRNADNPDWVDMIGADDGISVDVFIGEPAYLDRGFGRAALSQYLIRVALPHFAGETRAYIAQEPDNERAFASSAAVGFHVVRSFSKHGVELALMAADDLI